MLRCRRALPAMVAVVAVLVVLLLPARSAFAATIPAVPNTPPQDGVIGDGICSLREAVRNANADAQVSTDCPSGTGNDTITLAAGTYNLSVAQAAEPNDARGDLDLTDADGLTIQGAGAGATSSMPTAWTGSSTSERVSSTSPTSRFAAEPTPQLRPPTPFAGEAASTSALERHST